MLRIDLPETKDQPKKNVVFKKNTVAMVTVVLIALAAFSSAMFFNQMDVSAHEVEKKVSFGVGPLDMLGQKLITSPEADDLYLFSNDEDMAVVDFDGEEPSADVEQATTVSAETPTELTEDVAEEQIPIDAGLDHENDQNTAVSDQAALGLPAPDIETNVPVPNVNIAEQNELIDTMSMIVSTPSVEELQRQADEQLRAQSREKTIKAAKASDVSRRLAVQQAQAAEAKLKAQTETDYLYSLSHPQHRQYYSCLAIAGEVVKWIPNVEECPEDTAGAWVGTGDVNDGKGTYFVGHNPGVFHMLIDGNVGVGDVVSVWDEQGRAKAYTIDDVFVIDEGTLFDPDLQRRTVYSGGESITLQTCIDDGKRYKVFVAH